MAKTKIVDSICHTMNNSVERRKAQGGRGGSGGIRGRAIVRLDALACCEKVLKGRVSNSKEKNIDYCNGAFPFLCCGGWFEHAVRDIARSSIGSRWRRSWRCACDKMRSGSLVLMIEFFCGFCA